VSELRWHPLLEQWVVVTTHRQDRPQMPADWCPFCPGSGRVPDDYDVALYPNDFPAFSFEDPSAPGACDVVLYSPEHSKLPSELPVEQWEKVIALWTRRTQELAADPRVKHVAVFENTGEAVGVTMPHPHGRPWAAIACGNGRRIRHEESSGLLLRLVRVFAARKAVQAIHAARGRRDADLDRL
jgi:UDPglucose--hexose-1-phosphate uridylyltransferase